MKFSERTLELAAGKASSAEISRQKLKSFAKSKFEHEKTNIRNTAVIWDSEICLYAHASDGSIIPCPTRLADEVAFNAWALSVDPLNEGESS
jgi:hypothetical protein